MENDAAIIARMQQEIVGINHQVKDIKLRLEKNGELLATVHRLALQNEQVLEKLKEHDTRLKSMETRPLRWLDTALTAAISGLAGYLISALIKNDI